MKISNILINWYRNDHRKLPWRETQDPYHIWLSEIILQQTRVDQGLPYYHKFVEQFPTVRDLAAAEEQEILTLWQGLGYYSRARNLHTAAKMVVEQHLGTFPNTYEELLQLKGVGEYTAAAIASFAYDLPYPVLDGNVYRVISRLFAIADPINKPAGQKVIKQALADIFDDKNSALFNQAIMEFGAMHCTPKKPNCSECPFAANCLSLEYEKVDKIPYKEGKNKVRKVEHSYFFISYDNKTYIEQRTEGIWQNLFQFPLVEHHLNQEELMTELSHIMKPNAKPQISLFYNTTHILSHRKIDANFYTILVDTKPIFLKSNIFEIEMSQLGTEYPISVLTQKFLNKRNNNDK